MSLALLGFPDHVSKPSTTISSPGTVPADLPLTNLKTDEPSEVTRILSVDPVQTQMLFTFGGGTGVDISGLSIINHNLTADAQYRFVALDENGSSSWVYGQLGPNVLSASSNAVGALTSVDEPISSPDGLMMAPGTPTLSWSIRVGFTPTASTPEDVGMFVIRTQLLYVGAGADNPISLPRCVAVLRQAGDPTDLKTLGNRAVQVSASGGQVFIFPFQFSDLIDPSGADLELKLTFTPGTSVSGSSYAALESVRAYYDTAPSFILGYLASTDWLSVVSGADDETPTASDHHFPAAPWEWEGVQKLLLIVRSDQANHDPAILNSDGSISYPEVADDLPDGFIQIGIVEAGVVKSFDYGILTPGPLTAPRTQEFGDRTLGGQSYSSDLFQERTTEQMTLTVTREEAIWLQREVGWKKGLSKPFYLALEPNIDEQWQQFTAFWAVLAEDLGAPRKIGDYKPDGTMMMEITVRFREKL